MSISDQIQQHADGIKTAGVGLAGTGAAWGLQDISLVVSILVGVLTSFYIAVKIIKELRPRKE